MIGGGGGDDWDPATGRIVAMAASAGGLNSLREVLAGLSADFPAPILIVQHRGAAAPEMLAQLLGGATPLTVRNAYPGERLCAGVVLLAPPERHLVVVPGGRVDVLDRPAIRFLRPDADLLFISLALHFRERTIAVVLSGTGGDGALGSFAVNQAGGFVLVEDPRHAAWAAMPESAVATGCVDEVLRRPELAERLRILVHQPLRAGTPRSASGSPPPPAAPDP